MENFYIDYELYEKRCKSISDLNCLLDSVLLPNGFIILYDENNELIAFQPKTNILFQVQDKLSYTYERICFQQPYGNLVRVYKNYGSCNKVETEFPLFNKDNYLNLCNFVRDGFENYGFEPSLIRISQFPILMDAIGEENRNLIANILSSVDTQSLEQRNQIQKQTKVKTLRKI